MIELLNVRILNQNFSEEHFGDVGGGEYVGDLDGHMERFLG